MMNNKIFDNYFANMFNIVVIYICFVFYFFKSMMMMRKKINILCAFVESEFWNQKKKWESIKKTKIEKNVSCCLHSIPTAPKKKYNMVMNTILSHSIFIYFFSFPE